MQEGAVGEDCANTVGALGLWTTVPSTPRVFSQVGLSDHLTRQYYNVNTDQWLLQLELSHNKSQAQ